jgi:hypothetical protein
MALTLNEGPAEPVVVSALATETFTPPDSPRTYTLAPLSYRQRSAMLRELRRLGGIKPDRSVLLEGMRAALREIAPANLVECLAVIEAAEADPDDAAAQARLALVEQAVVDVPAYAALAEAQLRYNDAIPLVATRHALRGWDGPGLPPFATGTDGLVAETLLDLLPAPELTVLGWRAYVLAVLGRSAEGNSEGRSPSPAAPITTPAG